MTSPGIDLETPAPRIDPDRADPERAIASLRTRIGAVLGLRRAVALLAGWCLLWGAVVVVLRAVLFVPRLPLLWGFAGVAVVVVIGVITAIRRRPAPHVVRAMIDSRGHCGGLLMTAGAMEIGDWQRTLPQPEPLQVRWRGRRACAILLACAGFLLAGFLMPGRYIVPPNTQQLEVGAEINKLAEKVDLLAEEKILTPEKAESLKATLQKLQKESSGNDPAKLWEAMDHMEQSVAKASAEAAETASHDAQKSAQAEELSEALQKAQKDMPRQELAAAMKSLAQKVDQASEENAQLSEKLSEQMKDAAQKGALQPDQLKDLAKALKESKAADLQKLQKLAEARLIDPEALGECLKQCEGDPDALAEILAKCKEGKEGSDLDDILAQWEAKSTGKPGRGAATRGPGAAEITWTDKASEKDVKFKEQVLPPGAIASIKDSRRQGLSAGTPTSDPAAKSAAGGALDPTATGSGSAHTQVILPEHKGVIKRYFDRGAAGTAPAANTSKQPTTTGPQPEHKEQP